MSGSKSKLGDTSSLSPTLIAKFLDGNEFGQNGTHWKQTYTQQMVWTQVYLLIVQSADSNESTSEKVYLRQLWVPKLKSLSESSDSTTNYDDDLRSSCRNFSHNSYRRHFFSELLPPGWSDYTVKYRKPMDTSQMWLEANRSTLTFNTETNNCVYVGNVIDNPPNGTYQDQYEQIKTLWINVVFKSHNR